MRKNIFYILVFIAMVVLVGIGIFAATQSGQNEKVALGGAEMVVYKTPTCGCCAVYTKYLDREGVNVKVVDVDDLSIVKQEHGVPEQFESCHTSLIGGYFIEGHIPLEIVEKLIAEKPAIKGIMLPGMPSGSPGMPGTKTETWTIYALNNDGSVSEYMKY